MNRFALWALATAICLPATLFAAAAPAVKPGLAIAAVVGDEAITSYDVENRLRFVVTASKLSSAPEALERIRPQVVRALIDEKLQLQEAAHNKVNVSDDQVRRAIANIEEKRGMEAGSIFRMLEKNQVPQETFTQQIRAQLAWNELVIRKIRPQVKISEEEIDLARQKSAAPLGNQELQIAVLTLPVDHQKRENEIKRLSERLVKEMRGGASFEEVSRQFASGGKAEPFWIRPGQLDPLIAKVLARSKAGDISVPIRTAEGYAIVKVYNTRPLDGEDAHEYHVLLKEILLRLKPDADRKEADVLLSIGEEVARNPGSCEDKGVANISDLADFDIEVVMKEGQLSELPTAIKIIAQSLKVGEISTPFASNEGIRLYMLCGKKESAPAGDRERIYGALMQQRMELEAQKYMRNLRREAFVEVR